MKTKHLLATLFIIATTSINLWAMDLPGGHTLKDLDAKEHIAHISHKVDINVEKALAFLNSGCSDDIKRLILPYLIYPNRGFFWSLMDFKPIKIKQHRLRTKGPIDAVISKDNQTIAASFSTDTGMLYNMITKEKTRLPTGIISNCVTMNQDGSIIAVGDQCGNVYLFERSGNSLGVLSNLQNKDNNFSFLRPLSDEITSLIFHADNEHLIASTALAYCIWNYRTQQLAYPVFKGSLSSSTERYLVSKGKEDDAVDQCHVFVRSIVTGEVIRTLPHPDMVYEAKISNNNKFILSSTPHIACLWDIETGKCIKEIDENNEIIDIAFSPDNTHIFLALQNGIIVIYQINEQMLDWHKTLLPAGKHKCSHEHGHRQHTHIVKIGPISSDGQCVMTYAIGKNAPVITLWGIQLKQCIARIIDHPHYISSIRLSSDDGYLVTGCQDNILRVYQTYYALIKQLTPDEILALLIAQQNQQHNQPIHIQVKAILQQTQNAVLQEIVKSNYAP